MSYVELPNYLYLPPGRERRLAYSNYIHRQMTENRMTENRLTDYTYTNNYLYERYVELNDVKIGLISNKLISNSIIEESKGISFCSICQQDIFLEIIRRLKCNHHFHINCIDKWFIENKKCPQCRFDLND